MWDVGLRGTVKCHKRAVKQPKHVGLHSVDHPNCGKIRKRSLGILSKTVDQSPQWRGRSMCIHQPSIAVSTQNSPNDTSPFLSALQPL